MICVDLGLWFEFCYVDAKLLSCKILWCDYVEWNSTCNIKFCMSLNACLLEGFCFLVCMLKRVSMCIMHSLPKFNVSFAQSKAQGTS
jgi:hypothetical protein